LLHVNKYSLWFSINTAVILLGSNASGEGEEQAAAFGGEARPPRAAGRRAQSLPGLPWAAGTVPPEQMLNWDRGFCFTQSPCRAVSTQPRSMGGPTWPGERHIPHCTPVCCVLMTLSPADTDSKGHFLTFLGSRGPDSFSLELSFQPRPRARRGVFSLLRGEGSESLTAAALGCCSENFSHRVT